MNTFKCTITHTTRTLHPIVSPSMEQELFLSPFGSSGRSPCLLWALALLCVAVYNLLVYLVAQWKI